MNEFYLEIDALDHVQTYWLWVERDTVTPVIELYEITNRTSNLDSIRIIEGFVSLEPVLRYGQKFLQPHSFVELRGTSVYNWGYHLMRLGIK